MPESEDTTNNTEIDVNSEAFKTAVAQATEGLKRNRDEILAEKKTTAEALRKLESQMSELGDIEMVKNLVKRFQNDEEAKLIADGKIDEVLNRRTESLRADSDARVNAATEKLNEVQELYQSALSTIAELRVSSSVDAAASALGCAPTAIKDIRRAAMEVFSTNEETHEIEARDSSGVLLMGPDGQTALTPDKWLEQQKKSSPHWWGASAGGGALGGRGGTTTPTGVDVNKMTGRQLIQVGMTR